MNIQVGEELPREANIHTNRALDTANVFILDPEAAAKALLVWMLASLGSSSPICMFTFGGAQD